MKATVTNLTAFALLSAAIFLAPAPPAGAQAPAKPALTGTWKLNRSQSDDPEKKVVSDDNVPLGDSGIPTPTVGPVGGPDAGGLGMGMGGLGGGSSASLPPSAAAHTWETEKDRQKKLEYLLPAASLTVEQKDNEFDFVDDKSRKLIFYTDGRKLHKSKDEKLQEFAARFDNGHLIYDEKRPPRGTVTRTFELDDRQLVETVEIDNGSLAVPIALRYVYDAAPLSLPPPRNTKPHHLA